MAGALVFLVGQMFLFGTTSGECPVPCTPCKVFPAGGVYEGTWNLISDIDPRCIGSCLYKRESDGEEMCFCDPGKTEYTTTCLGCDCTKGCNETNTWLVVTGGADYARSLVSTEIISSTGVCTPTIPSLPGASSAGAMAFMNWNCTEGELIFCGGSTTFVPHTDPISSLGAATVATNKCYSLSTGNPTVWSVFSRMLQERAWFSLTKIDPHNMIAVGGIDASGVPTNTMEQYSFNTHTWNWLPTPLPQERWGHCTVPDSRGNTSYLIVIGGSDALRPVDTVYQVNVATSETKSMANLPKPLFRPACTISCAGDIFVSGGVDDSGIINTNVYKYTAGTWSTVNVGGLSPDRWGHVMGMVGASVNRKMSVAGGFDGTSLPTSVEDSIDPYGVTWSTRRTGLLVGRIVAAAAEVPANTFSCQG